MTKSLWIIDWTIEGTMEIEAESATEAQDIFDARFGSRKFLDPLRDGEVYNDTPYQIRRPRDE